MDKYKSGATASGGESGISFWKKNTKTVPGRPSPQKEASTWVKGRAGGGTSSFQDFQDSVRDAWDIEDDEFAAMASDVKISKTVAQSAALNVINCHRSGVMLPKTDDEGNCEPSRKSTDQTGNSRGSYAGAITEAPVSRSNSAKHTVIVRSETEQERTKSEKVQQLLNRPSGTDLKELQSLSYSGLPISVRGTAWKVLAGYLPTNVERRKPLLERKREEYWKCVQQYYGSRLDESHQDTFRQIHIDIPRMCPLISLFQQKVVQEMFERILFIWAIRHPASGYVQGMNDLVTPFFVVFLEEILPTDVEVETYDVSKLPEDQRNNIEADSYWCMSKFLDSIQVNYIFAQTGIQEKVRKLKELIERIDAPLNHHLHRHDIDYLQFSFRWMNNLLMRELPLRCTIRLWDTYLAEPDGCGSVLLYVCAAFLRHWRDKLMEQKDFQGLMLLLQNLPTQNWNSAEISLIVAEAYRLKYTFDSAQKHFSSGS